MAGRESLSIRVASLDVTDGDAVQNLIAAAIEAEGRVDVLVNNAGIPGPVAAIEEVDEAAAREAMETNFWAPFRLSRAVLPHMRQQGSGTIDNVSTFGVRCGGGTRAAFFYSVSKRALHQLSLLLRAELDSTGVRVIDIEPGAFATEIHDASKRRPIDDSSPHATMVRTVDNVLAGMISGGADPSIVADAILAAVNDTNSPTCVLVGDDAVAAVRDYEVTQAAA